MSKEENSFKEKLHKGLGHVMAVIAVFLVLVVFGGAYYLVIAPNLIPKPFIPEPALPEDALERINNGEHVINESHINYIINEIGAYKLRNTWGTADYPVMEFVLTDLEKKYHSFVENHLPITKEKGAKEEDIAIKGSQEVVVEILSAENTKAAVKKAIDEGKIQVDIVKDMNILARKGYLSIYDSIK